MKEEQSPKKQSRTKRWDTRYWFIDFYLFQVIYCRFMILYCVFLFYFILFWKTVYHRNNDFNFILQKDWNEPNLPIVPKLQINQKCSQYSVWLTNRRNHEKGQKRTTSFRRMHEDKPKVLLQNLSDQVLILKNTFKFNFYLWKYDSRKFHYFKKFAVH